MIAMPIKTNHQNSALAPLFGKAKFFAFVDNDGKISIEENNVSGGVHVARAFQEKGVTTLVTAHLGEKPFHALMQAGIQVYFAGDERITVEEAYSKFKEGALVPVDITNYMAVLGEENHGGHHHEHGHGGECCSHEHVHEHEGEKKVRCCEKEGRHRRGAQACREGKFHARSQRCCQKHG